MFWQLESQVVPFGGSHCSPVSTVLLPQRFERHWPCRHTLPLPQSVPLGSCRRVLHRCVESLQEELPWQISGGAQLRELSVETQTKRQLESQPCEPSLVPSS